MPVYDFVCNNCGNTEEIEMKMSEYNPNHKCKKCQSILSRVYNFSGISFKGTGFYVNDYTNNK
jgi:putative FmdB family regulatory protein